MTASRARRLLHLLWALPLVAVIQLPVAIAVKLNWCGFTNCMAMGDQSGIPGAGAALFILLIDACLTAGILTLAPWIAPLRLRATISVIVGIGVAVFWLLSVTAFPELLWA